MNQIPTPSAAAPRVAVLASTWHADLVNRALDGIDAEFARQGQPAPRRVTVPGAFEIPLHAQALARSGRVDAVIACALVVDGGIYRHEFVAASVIDALMRVQLDTGVPVFSAVLTPHAFHEHDTHRQFFAEHLAGKGREVAQACLATLASLAALAQPG